MPKSNLNCVKMKRNFVDNEVCPTSPPLRNPLFRLP